MDSINIETENTISGTVAQIVALMCSAMLAEAQEISKAGFPELRRDLFMEQGKQ